MFARAWLDCYRGKILSLQSSTLQIFFTFLKLEQAFLKLQIEKLILSNYFYLAEILRELNQLYMSAKVKWMIFWLLYALSLSLTAKCGMLGSLL